MLWTDKTSDAEKPISQWLDTAGLICFDTLDKSEGPILPTYWQPPPHPREPCGGEDARQPHDGVLIVVVYYLALVREKRRRSQGRMSGSGHKILPVRPLLSAHLSPRARICAKYSSLGLFACRRPGRGSLPVRVGMGKTDAPGTTRSDKTIAASTAVGSQVARESSNERIKRIVELD
jgi:hypothetical protein